MARKKQQFSYEDQAIATLFHLTKCKSKSQTSRKINSRILHVKWSRYATVARKAENRGFLNRGKWMKNSESSRWTWNSISFLNSIDIENKRFLNILNKGFKRIHIEEEGRALSCPIVHREVLQFHGLEKETYGGRIYNTLVNLKKNERKKILESEFQDDMVIFDMISAYLSITAWKWSQYKNSSNQLKKECLKILNNPNNFIDEFISFSFNNLNKIKERKNYNGENVSIRDVAKHQIRALIGDKNWKTRRFAWKTLVEFMQIRYPAFISKLFSTKQNLHLQATKFESKLWRGVDGIEIKFINKCKRNGMKPKFQDLHDGIIVAKHQAHIMESCIIETCKQFGYNFNLILGIKKEGKKNEKQRKLGNVKQYCFPQQNNEIQKSSYQFGLIYFGRTNRKWSGYSLIRSGPISSNRWN